MLIDANGNVFDYRNRKQRRFDKFNKRHKIFTKKYHNKRSKMRSINYLKEQE